MDEAALRSGRRPVAVLSVVALLAGACLLGGAPARADRGVAIDLGRIEITEGLVPGGGYRLPVIGVSNPGDEPTSYRMTVSYVSGQEGLEPPGGWFRFEPVEFTLLPGETQAVRARISLPMGADPGDYEALLAAQAITEGKGAQVGAAAASRLSFTVAPASALEAYWLKLKGFFTAHAPWTWIAPAMLFGLLAGWQFRRRLTLTVARR